MEICGCKPGYNFVVQFYWVLGLRNVVYKGYSASFPVTHKPAYCLLRLSERDQHGQGILILKG